MISFDLVVLVVRNRSGESTYCDVIDLTCKFSHKHVLYPTLRVHLSFVTSFCRSDHGCIGKKDIIMLASAIFVIFIDISFFNQWGINQCPQIEIFSLYIYLKFKEENIYVVGVLMSHNKKYKNAFCFRSFFK